MSRPRLLDLFCGAGGASMGYHRAGFDVTGVDNRPMPRYPFAFVESDALAYVAEHGREYDAIHASPPCHHYSTGTQHRKRAGIVYPDLLVPTQDLLRASGRPYTIENVPGAARLLRAPILLCGGMFGLGVMRHRYFETNVPAIRALPHSCNGDRIDRDAVSVTRHGPPPRWYRKHPGATFRVTIWHDAMGINWMDRRSLTQAIPPAYTEHIGAQLLAALEG
jgi:DNA (cytosine-5)-methyltransferase 1